jgi:hypothetical protein
LKGEIFKTIILPVAVRHITTLLAGIGVSSDDTQAQVTGTIGLAVSVGFALAARIKQRRKNKANGVK